MTNADDLAYPRQSDDVGAGAGGLTKREHFAVMVLPSLIALESDAGMTGECHDAVRYADALIEALNK